MNKFIYAVAAVAVVTGFTVAAYAQNTPQVIINIPGMQGTQSNQGNQNNQGNQPQADRHPEVHAAIDKMKHAKEDLDKATKDYGGHKEKAQKLLDAAQEELRQGIDYADHHDDHHHHYDHN